MISHKNKCIFIHIPKVAGTSLISLLRDTGNTAVTKEKNIPFSFDFNRIDPPSPHLKAIDYIKYGYTTADEFNSYFKFAFVRNPWDRIVSEYKYRRHPARYDFKTFLFHHFPQPSWTDAYCHVIPQYYFLYDDSNKCLVDYVGRFENLESDFRKVCHSLNLPELKIPHKNKSLSLFRRDNNLYHVLKTIKDAASIKQKRNTFSTYTEYYDDETIQWVAQVYKKDILTFGYEFGE
ncbi:MAG: hypothetical protein D3910_00405 [Candidatus Electrothrix sp. ATG2]|nr:hypothetical protein [Candidatus Electrothrix sp. ATG2]